MVPPREVLGSTLAEWLDELAASRGAPASGAALGVTVASAAALLVMVARTSGDGGLAAQAEALRARATPLAQRDADAYDTALRVREDTSELKPERRDWQIGQTIAAAAEPPLEIGRTAADVAALARRLAEVGEPRVRADAVAAAALAAAAARGAVALVAANLTALDGDPRVAEAERLAADAEEAARACRLLVS